MFPQNYYFAVSRTGIDGRRSLLVERRERRTSSTGALGSAKESGRRSSLMDDASQPSGAAVIERGEFREKTPADEANVDDRADEDMEDLTCAMSALRFIPHSIKFGRGGGRAGFARR